MGKPRIKINTIAKNEENIISLRFLFI